MPWETTYPSHPLPTMVNVRLSIERLIWLLCLLFLARAWLLDGFPVPCQVVGGSMAETLLGPHHEVVCGDCADRFVIEAAVQGAGYRVACPNCGFVVHGVEPLLELPGDRVLIDKTAFWFHGPRRWDVMAFRYLARGGSPVVKRVVGLPGETVQIRDGDVFISGIIQRKTLDQQRALRQLVHDASFPPRIEPVPPARWGNQSADGRWTETNGQFCHNESPDADSIDWLVYRHWRRGTRPGEVFPGPVTDICSYNHASPRREEEVQVVRDVMLSVRVVEVAGRGSLWFRASDGREAFLVRMDPCLGRCELLGHGRPSPIMATNMAGPLDGSTLEVSLFDQQLLLAIGGRTLMAHPFERARGHSPPTSEPLAIGCQGLRVVLKNLKVYRDVYYTRSPDEKTAAELDEGLRLGENEFFVLGDNSPISEDSRTWLEDRTVHASELLGRPLLVLFPARSVWRGHRQFQVPDPNRIRYIR